MNNFNSVTDMYLKFGLKEDEDLKARPKLIPDKTVIFRIKALQEELSELEEGYKEQDLPKIADSLVDLVVFALGTATLHNLPWEDLFTEVMRANNDKVAKFTDIKARNGSGSIDLTKPTGWRGPDIEKVLKDYGWIDSEE